jgi:transcriptional regulator with XRE-family HTH domain
MVVEGTYIPRCYVSGPRMGLKEQTTLGVRIRRRRKTLGLTLVQVSARAGIDRSYLGGVERGKRNLTFSMLCGICAALECDVESLTDGLPERLLYEPAENPNGRSNTKRPLV